MKTLPPIPPNNPRFKKRDDGFTEFLIVAPNHGDFGTRQGDKPGAIVFHVVLDDPKWPPMPEVIEDAAVVAELARRARAGEAKTATVHTGNPGLPSCNESDPMNRPRVAFLR